MKKIFSLIFAAAAIVGVSADTARAENIVVTTTQNQIITFDSATPGVTTAPVTITGLQAGETIVGIDRRPADGQIYGISNTGRIYTLNSTTGAATFVSTTSVSPNGGAFGVDFNPVPDRLRVVSNTDQNLRINVVGGATITDGALAFASGDPNFGQNPNVVTSAYTNNFAGATTTTLYGIDSNLGILVIQNPPNNGTLNTVGSLGVTSSDIAGFDISGQTGIAYAVLNPNGGFSSLFSINLSTGAATLIGQIGTGFLISGIAAPVGANAAVPEPATMLLLGTGLAGVALKRRKRNKE